MIALIPDLAHAYIDPGVTYALLQGLFALMLGGAAAFVLRPWNYLKRVFGGSSQDRSDKGQSLESDSDESK